MLVWNLLADVLLRPEDSYDRIASMGKWDEEVRAR
jgi:hypothetical protein